MENRVLILVGHYGTGKTTIALNLALDWAIKKAEIVDLADLDVNNPYFRSRDWITKLKGNNVNLIIPDEKIAYAENPFLPKEIYSVIQNKKRKLIIDLGGHEVGTKVLGSISEQVEKSSYQIWMVVNTYRPNMETKEEIKSMFYRLQELSNLKISGLINNTNLTNMTKIEDVIHGEEIVSQTANELGIIFIGNTIEENLMDKAMESIKTPIIPIKRFDLLKWSTGGEQ